MHARSPRLVGAGVAFKPMYFDALLGDPQRVDFIEIHAENYFGAGGVLHAQLAALREQMPLSVHGVGLSIGGSAPLDKGHMQRLKHLCERYEPILVSEHLAWSAHAGEYLGDLLPVAYHAQSLERVAAHVQQLQDVLGRQVLIENPATYLRLAESELTEAEFIRQLCQSTGCGILLDLNNLLVSCHNCADDPQKYLAELPSDQVLELHLAGHARVQHADRELLVDEHGSEIADATWGLYAEWLAHAGARPCLIEWDRHLPSWSVLAAEVDCARTLQCNPLMLPRDCGWGTA